MTTKHSPLSVLQHQADWLAAMVKAFERGDSFGSPALKGVDARTLVQIAAARLRGEFKTGIVMDDKVLVITLPWSKIEETSEVALSAWILSLIREERAS